MRNCFLAKSLRYESLLKEEVSKAISFFTPPCKTEREKREGRDREGEREYLCVYVCEREGKEKLRRREREREMKEGRFCWSQSGAAGFVGVACVGRSLRVVLKITRSELLPYSDFSLHGSSSSLPSTPDSLWPCE